MNQGKKWKKVFRVLLLVAVLLLAGGSRELLAGAFSVAGLGSAEATCISTDRYAHNMLSERQQRVYDEMLDAMMQMKDHVRLSTTDKSDVMTCYHAICADYGEIFWVDRCSYSEYSLFGQPCAVGFDVTYTYTKEEVADYQEKLRPVIDDYRKQLMACESDYEKTELLYRKLIQDVTYDPDAENNQNILSVFLGKATVCQGYACAVQYLLQQVGIPCVIVTGTAQGQPHAWNMARLDGDYYYIDVTWGNADFLGEAQHAVGGINYGYLNITSAELLMNHQPQVDFPLGICDSTENNYYVRKGLFFERWDADAIGQRFMHAYEEDEESVSVKFADSSLLAQARDYFIDDRHITDYCEGISRIYYVQDQDINTLTIYF